MPSTSSYKAYDKDNKVLKEGKDQTCYSSVTYYSPITDMYCVELPIHKSCKYTPEEIGQYLEIITAFIFPEETIVYDEEDNVIMFSPSCKKHAQAVCTAIRYLWEDGGHDKFSDIPKWTAKILTDYNVDEGYAFGLAHYSIAQGYFNANHAFFGRVPKLMKNEEFTKILNTPGMFCQHGNINELPQIKDGDKIEDILEKLVKKGTISKR